MLKRLFTPLCYSAVMIRAPTPTRFAELDALRGLAALAVVLFHLTWRASQVLAGAQTIPWGLEWGRFGVHLFFSISGFVIFMTLERTSSAADFAVSRLARLFPAYWCAVLLTALGVVALGAPELGQPPQIVLANLTMLQGFDYVPPVDGVYWSLTVELAFYLCMLALWKAQLLHRIELVLLGWLALMAAWELFPQLPSRVGLLLCVRYIAWFVPGILAYRVWTGARRPAQQVLPWLAGLAAILVGYQAAIWPVYLVVSAIYAGLIAGRLGWLRQRLLIWLGAISYPLYLIHQHLGYALIARLEALGAGPWLALVLTIAAALAASEAIHRWVEAPSLGAIRQLWKARSTARLTPEPAA